MLDSNPGPIMNQIHGIRTMWYLLVLPPTAFRKWQTKYNFWSTSGHELVIITKDSRAL